MLIGHLAPLYPRSDRMHGNPARLGYSFGGAGGFDDVGMGSHGTIMQNASRDCKRLLHYPAFYAERMDTPNERLRLAREAAGFATAVDAADALGVPRSTYIGHENGHRGFPAKRAPTYARRFKVSEEWLLYGKGDMVPTGTTTAQVINIFERMPADKHDEAIRVLKALANLRE